MSCGTSINCSSIIRMEVDSRSTKSWINPDPTMMAATILEDKRRGILAALIPIVSWPDVIPPIDPQRHNSWRRKEEMPIIP